MFFFVLKVNDKIFGKSDLYSPLSKKGKLLDLLGILSCQTLQSTTMLIAAAPITGTKFGQGHGSDGESASTFVAAH